MWVLKTVLLTLLAIWVIEGVVTETFCGPVCAFVLESTTAVVFVPVVNVASTSLTAIATLILLYHNIYNNKELNQTSIYLHLRQL